MRRGAVRRRSASGAITAGDLPPSSNVTGVRFSAARDRDRARPPRSIP
jgi:hypothetical protein